MCFPNFEPAEPLRSFVEIIIGMEYPLPGPVVALLQQENASLAPKSYFISSGKKSIKITLVYAKGEGPANESSASSGERKKPRHGSSSKQASKTTRHTRSKKFSESSSSTSNEQASGSTSHSENDQACASPELPLGAEHHTGREGMSTVDSGHPSSSGTIVHGANSESGSDAEDEGEEQDCDSDSSSEIERPKTPGRDIAVAASSIGPGETPASRRDEMWQTWTRIPRTQASSRAHKLQQLTAPISTIRRSLSPHAGSSYAQRSSTPSASQRRPRLHEGVSWDGSGNL